MTRRRPSFHCPVCRTAWPYVEGVRTQKCPNRACVVTLAFEASKPGTVTWQGVGPFSILQGMVNIQNGLS